MTPTNNTEEPTMSLEKPQHYRSGDHIRLKDKFNKGEGHSTGEGKEAVVEHNYAEAYGGDNRHSMSLIFADGGRSAWYESTCVEEFLGHDRLDLAAQWAEAREALRVKQSDINWIFTEAKRLIKEHGTLDGLRKLHVDCYERLGRDLGIADLWGSNGEGYVYIRNLQAVLFLASRALMNETPEAWLTQIAPEYKSMISQYGLQAVVSILSQKVVENTDGQ